MIKLPQITVALFVFLLICFGRAKGYFSKGHNQEYIQATRDSSSVLQGSSDGMMAFRQWVQQKYKLPKKAVKERVYGKVEVSFIVEKDGSLSSFEILKDLGYGTGDALIKVLRKAPKWEPGIQNGKPVRVQYKLPIYVDAW
ncbi:energy transducer TonB [Sphingobacterium sp. SGG-5]|uniref:energy transducer TonB n=1 Tax=Sphingobacterium sp. SGG-5 TaxID=2710881 RepID=UPI0019D2823E|nr:energy transducer TonB [Sphingobacterium sp. SGG-5]